MAKKNKYNEITEGKLVYTNTDQQVDLEITPTVEEKVVVDPNPLHTQYQKFIDMANDGYLVGLEYPQAMEMLRYCERKRGIQFGLNMNCPNCLLALVKMFDNLRDK